MSHRLFRRCLFSVILAMLSATAGAGHAMAADGETSTTVQSSQSVQSQSSESVVVESSISVHSENGVSVVEESHTVTSDSVTSESTVSTNGQAGVSGGDFGASSEHLPGDAELAADPSLEDLVQDLIEILFETLGFMSVAGNVIQ